MERNGDWGIDLVSMIVMALRFDDVWVCINCGCSMMVGDRCVESAHAWTVKESPSHRLRTSGLVIVCLC